MQLDVYTCSALNTADVFAALAEFEPHHVEFKSIDREHNLTLLDKGVV
jgi:S-adenosylmethionine/arginine decarboxylase-like enzyme